MSTTPIITCEHAGNIVPERYAFLFEGAEDVLQSHRGWDPGAAEIAEQLANRLRAPLFMCQTSRLLVEPNRSLGTPSLFSEYSITLPELEREHILRDIYFHYRNAVEGAIKESKDVLHLSIHTFTPILDGVIRKVDVGLLFDPSRKNETRFSESIRRSLEPRLPSLRIEFNEPYKGIDDGLTTYLRTRFSDSAYSGIEIEVNQRLVDENQLEIISEALATVVTKCLS